MSMDVGGAKGGVKSDINVTPLVDVMLVLLIIMMIVAPLLQQGVKLTLPMATHTEDKPDTQEQVVVFVDAVGKLYVNTLEVREEDLPARITAALEKTGGKTVYLKGDAEAQYGHIMKMMDALRKAQIDTVGLITEKPGGSLPTPPKGGGN
jgi:biopolymer transport protein ExbD